MGLDTSSIKFCCTAKSLGVDFSKMLMIGRQSLFPDVKCLQRIFEIQGIDIEAAEFLEKHKYGEEFFSLLGAQEIDSLDYSDYEDATIIHDMNSPIPEKLKERFSVVYDGGTLEHVFNVPQALKNSMEMVEIGGHFLQANIANNFMGHGFWQFSPELLFRVFSEENGFKTEIVLLHEVVPDGGWYSVSDPNKVHQRVNLCNSKPTYILTIAKRVSNVEVFATPPLQSDYSALWEKSAREAMKSSLNPCSSENDVVKTAQQRTYLRQFLPEPVKRILRPIIYRRIRNQKNQDPFDKPYYQKISEDHLLHGIL